LRFFFFWNLCGRFFHFFILEFFESFFFLFTIHQVPERVPFRLTRNMADAMGLGGSSMFGLQGIFRQSAEAVLRVCRENKSVLISQLQTFVHDPLMEISGISGGWRASPDPALEPVPISPLTIMETIAMRLEGKVKRNQLPLNVAGQASVLMEEATNEYNLGLMWRGWMPWV
jgi:phosphatidylinositol kinase/protein kinase (PI-3  family)